jgi:hypothetical protein
LKLNNLKIYHYFTLLSFTKLKTLFIKPILCLLFSLISCTGFAQIFTVGTGAGSSAGNSGNTGYPSPYNNYWGRARHQFLIRAGELTALGASAGVIKSLAFNVAGLNNPSIALPGFTIGIKQTTDNALTTTFQTGFTTVFSQAYTPALGWNTHTFSTCFNWDGTSNLIIETCYANTGAATTGARTFWTTALGFNASAYSYSAVCGQNVTPDLSPNRPNMQLSISPDIMDAAVTAITSPTSFITVGSNNPVSITIKNTACSGNLTSATVGYRINNGTPSTVAWTGNLAPGASASVNVAPNYVPSGAGFVMLKGFVTLPNGLSADADRSNDSLNQPILVNDPAAPTNAFEGTDFWASFAQSLGTTAPAEPNKYLFLTSTRNAVANVTIPLMGYAQNNINIAANTIVRVTIPNGSNYYCRTGNANSNAGINITSDNPISVYGLSQIGASTDGWLAIPTANLSTEYIAMSPTGSSDLTTSNPAMFMVIATQAGTTNLTLRLPAGKAATGRAAGSTWNITLNRGQVYYLTSNGISNNQFDLTGTQITSDQKVAVLSGAICASYPERGNTGAYATCTPCDHIVEQIIPTNAWGGTYVAAPFYYNSSTVNTNMSYIRVISYETGTTTYTVSGVGGAQTLTGRGSYRDFQINSGAVVQSSQKISVYEIMASSSCNGAADDGDPAFMNSIPEEQWGQYYSFVSCDLNQTDERHLINVVTKGSNAGIYVDGTLLSGYTQIPNTSYYYKAIQVSEGNHAAIGDQPFMVYVYGIRSVESYAYPASGAALATITVPVSLLKFEARLTRDNTVGLSWSTASEKNNDHFVVERSTDGLGFSPVSPDISGAGNSSSLRSYSFTDSKPSPGINFYRLRQVDFNGVQSLSAVVTADVSSPFGGITIGPQPLINVANVSFSSLGEGLIDISIYDITGRSVAQQRQAAAEGQNTFSLDISGLSKGAYFLSLTNDTGASETVKLIKE